MKALLGRLQDVLKKQTGTLWTYFIRLAIFGLALMLLSLLTGGALSMGAVFNIAVLAVGLVLVVVALDAVQPTGFVDAVVQGVVAGLVVAVVGWVLALVVGLVGVSLPIFTFANWLGFVLWVAAFAITAVVLWIAKAVANEM